MGDWGGGGGLGGFGGGSNFFSQKFKQIWCVSYMNGTCTGTIFWVPTILGLGEGSKI